LRIRQGGLYKEFILKGTINNTVPFLRDGSFKAPGFKNQGSGFLENVFRIRNNEKAQSQAPCALRLVP